MHPCTPVVIQTRQATCHNDSWTWPGQLHHKSTTALGWPDTHRYAHCAHPRAARAPHTHAAMSSASTSAITLPARVAAPAPLLHTNCIAGSPGEPGMQPTGKFKSTDSSPVQPGFEYAVAIAPPSSVQLIFTLGGPEITTIVPREARVDRKVPLLVKRARRGARGLPVHALDQPGPGEPPRPGGAHHGGPGVALGGVSHGGFDLGGDTPARGGAHEPVCGEGGLVDAVAVRV